MRILAIMTACVVVSAMPPQPGTFDPVTDRSITTGDPAPVFPDWFGKPGPNLLKGFDYCETVTILMQFPDNRADTLERTPARFDSMLYSTGVFNQGPYRAGSLNDFFLENSYGAYDVRGAIAGDRWFASRHNYSRYYDNNYLLSTGGQLARENVAQVDSFVDFREFDINGDNYIDAMFMVHAGADGADNGDVNCCWSHAIPGFDYLTNDGVRIRGVTNVPEFAMVTEARDTTMCCIAVMCHELGHLVGLPDLYDGSRRDWGPGYWSLMSYGAWGAGGNTPWSPSHMDPWCKDEAGFVTPTVITQNTWDLAIPDIEANPVIYKVWQDGRDSDTCFYLENRQQKGFDSPIPGPGLAIWHFDRGAGSWYNRVDLEEDSTSHLDSGFGYRPDPHVYHEEMGDTSDVLPGIWNRTAFNDTTVPSSRRRAGTPTNVNVCNIRVQGDTIICDVLLNDSVAVAEKPSSAPLRLRLRPSIISAARPWVDLRVDPAGLGDRVRLFDCSGGLVREAGLAGTDTRFPLNGVIPGIYYLRLGTSSAKLVVH